MNFRKHALSMSSLIVTVALTSCSPESPKLVPLVDPSAKKAVRDVDQTDSFKSGFNPKVDILFVVDDSGSMDTHQSNLAANVGLFSQALSSSRLLDVHIGVVTTSMDQKDPNEPPTQWANPCDSRSNKGTFEGARACGDGRLVYYKTKVRYVEKSTPNRLQVLQDNLLVGISGSASEMVFDPVHAALTEPVISGENAGFYRPDASLAIVFVTDAEDQSEEMDANSLYDFLVKLKDGDPDKVLGYGVLVPSNDKKGCARDDVKKPKQIETFLKLVKGSEFGLCDDDYGKKLAGIAADVAQKVGQLVYLSTRPDPETIVVTYGTQTIPSHPVNGWTYDPQKNALRFGSGLVITPQPKGTRLQVNFESSGIEK